MATEPDQIRAEIEATRQELAGDVDRLADRTSPKRIAERRWAGMKSTWRRTTDRVMGVSERAQYRAQDTAHGIADRAQDAAHSVADTARQAPATVARKTGGNPLAAGMIAFGAGLLTASLLPETQAERRAGEQLAGHADRVVEPLKETGRELGGQLKERAQEAAAEVKDTARQAATEVKEQARESGQDAAAQTREAARS